MRNTLATLALAATLTAGVSGIAFAQACPPGYMLQGGYCQPAPTPGGVVGGAVGAAGAIAGGAIGAAGAIVGGTVGAVTGAPACGVGYTLYNGGCYPAR
jgi:hypothetical protein